MGNHKSVETTRASYIKPKSKTEVREKIKELMNDKNSEV
jgi:integrase/recombinase XerC